MLDCYRNVQLSFAQIHHRHFAGKARPTVANRLSALRRHGLLTSENLGHVYYQRGRVAAGTVYQTTRSGLRLLHATNPDESFREASPPINQASLVHDLLLTDVLAVLALRNPDCHVTNGRLADVTPGRSRRAPDAVMVSIDGSRRIAVELELTAKSEMRYRAIIFQYRSDPSFHEVLYVVAGRAIEAKIRRQIAGRRMVPGLPAPDTGKFSFVALEDLRGGNSPSEKGADIWT